MAASFATHGFLSLAMFVIGVANGLSLVQMQPTGRPSPYVIMNPSGSPDTQEGMILLNEINCSLSRVSAIAIAANSTSYSVMGQVQQAISAMQNSVAALSKSVAIAAQMGAGDLVDQANMFIDKANSILSEAQTKLPSALKQVSASLAAIMPQPTALADAFDEMVGDVCNHSGSAQSIHQTQGASLIAREARQSRHADQHAQKRGHNAEGVASLKHRVFQNRDVLIASDVEGALRPKKPKMIPTGQEHQGVTQADYALRKLEDMIAKIRAAIINLLTVPLDAAFGAFDAINATITPALADLPDKLAQPASAALNTLLSKRESLRAEAQSKVSEVAAGIQGAAVSLNNAVPLARKLQAAMDAKCLESSGTADANVTECGGTTEAETAASSGTQLGA